MSPNPTRLARLVQPAANSRSDGDLLTAFLTHRDEAAFAELVRRHGPVVRAACRRILPDPADADDAFQAAFLVLVRRGPRLDTTQPLGAWMYRVAVLTARTLRRGNARRFTHLEPLPALVPTPDAADDARLDLDAALLALPEKYRTPLILCHLQGWSRHAAAAQLGCREGTLSSLLSRGLVKLKARLRGYDPTAALVAGTSPVPLTLAAATARAAAGVGPSPVALGVTAEVLRGWWVTKVSSTAAAVVALVGVGFCAVAVSWSPAPPPTTAATPAPGRVREIPPMLPLPVAVAAKRIDVCVGGPLGGVPLRATEHDPDDGVPRRSICFTSTDGFQSYVARARVEAPVPPRLRVDVWDGVPAKHTRAVFGACRAAGYRTVNVRGLVPTINPGGWREFDDTLVDLADLAPPAQANAGGGGGKAGGCALRPGTCRAEIDLP